MADFNGKLAVQQRVLPTYRVPFFEQLADLNESGLGFFSGTARNSEAISSGKFNHHKVLHWQGNNVHIGAGPLYICWQQGLLNWLEDYQPDVLVVEANPRYLTTPKAIQWMHERGRPVLGWGLGVSEVSGLLGGFRKRERETCVHSLDGISAYSEKGAEEYRQFGIPENRVFTAHNAAVLPPTQAIVREPFVKRATILFVGRLQRRKRLDVLFQACATIPLHLQPNVLIAGDGPDRGYFESFAREIFPDALFLGAKYGDELEVLYKQADLFVLPGTGGLAIQQAMAHSLPVIVAEGDGTQDDLVRPENGWLVTPGDVQSLADALTNALADPENLVEMGAESYRIVCDEINLRTMAEKFLFAVGKISELGLKEPGKS